MKDLLTEIIDSLNNLGGQAHTNEVAKDICERNNIKYDHNFYAKVEARIEASTNDSKVPNKKHIFFKIDEKTRGFYGLVEPNLSIKNILDYQKAIIFMKKGQLESADILLTGILKEYQENGKDIPSFLYHGFIYFNMLIYNSEEINKEKKRKSLLNIMFIFKKREIRVNNQESSRKDSEY